MSVSTLDLAGGREEAARHIAALTGSADTPVLFATFDDVKDRKDKSLTRSRAGTLAQHWHELAALNARGAGVYIVVNEMRDAKRGKAEFVASRAVWQEDDSLGAAPVPPLAPHIVVESSSGKFHRYWRVRIDDRERFDAVMRGMVEDWGSDPCAADAARVLRLAGTMHMKRPDSPWFVVLRETRDAPPYTVEEIEAVIVPRAHDVAPPWVAGGATLGRNDELARVAGWYRRHGMDEAGIYERVRAINAAFPEPLPAAELRTIARSIAKYPAGPIPPEPEPLEFVNFAALAERPAAPRSWLVPEWIARGTVTLLAGAGGVGKSLGAQQLAVAVANGIPWLGLECITGPVLGLFCEDDRDELERRAERMFRAAELDPRTASRNLHLSARAGELNALVAFGLDRLPIRTALLEVVERQCDSLRPVLLILDNAAQLFAGVENDRAHVTAFANELTGIARRFDTAVVLLAHPAKVAGSEYSGSTAWEAAVRTRLFLERTDECGGLVLRKAKANYAGRDEFALEYVAGTLQRRTAASDAVRVESATAAVLDALATFTARQVHVSHLPAARNELVRLAAVEGLLGSIDHALARRALAELIAGGRVRAGVELPWRDGSRHKVRGLALATEGGE